MNTGILRTLTARVRGGDFLSFNDARVNRNHGYGPVGEAAPTIGKDPHQPWPTTISVFAT